MFLPVFYPYPSGSLVNDSGTVYFISGTTKVPFANAEAFVGLGYSFGNVIQGDLSAYSAAQSYTINTVNMAHPWGSWLIYKGTVYYSAESGLIGVPSSTVFTSNGGNWNLIVKANSYDVAGLDSTLPILTMNDSRVITSPSQSSTQTNTTTQTNNTTQSNTTTSTAQHPAGTLVNDSGTIYLIVDGGKLGIPDLSTFNSWNYSFNSAVSANASDRALPQVGVVYPKGSDKNTSTDTTIQAMLNIALDPNTAPAGTVAPGSVDVAVGAFRFSASHGEATVGISGPVSDSASCNFSDVKLFDASTGVQIGATLSSLAVTSGVCQGQFKNINFLVPNNTSKTVILKVTIPSSASGSFRFNLGGIVTSAPILLGASTYSNTMNITSSTNSIYDVNGDGQVTVADFQKEYNAVMGIDTNCGLKCDLNGDGAVNVADLQKMINYLIGATTTTSTPTLSVISPNGGGIYKIGSTVTIQWTAPGMTSSNNNIGLSVYDAATRTKIVLSQYGANSIVGGQVSTTGSYSWTIPSTVAPGNYLVYISTSTGWDESNASFSITQ